MDPVVIDAAKVLAERTHQSMGAVVSELARKGLEISTPGALETVVMPERSPISRKNGFPVFSVPADAMPITSDEVKKILNDEDLPD